MPQDDFLLDDEEDEGTEQQAVADPKQNAAFAQMRKEKKALEKELSELRAFRQEQEKAQRTATVAEAFKQVGLQPDWAEFYQGEDASAEAVRQWAIAKKFLQPAEGEPAPEPVAPPTTGFTPTVIEGGTSLGSKIYTHDEFTEMLKTDQARAFQLYQAGRVKLDKLEP